MRELLDRVLGKASQKVDMDVCSQSADPEPMTDEEKIELCRRCDSMHMLPPGTLECGVNNGLIRPKEAQRAGKIKAFMEQTRKEMDAEPDEPPGSGKFGAWRRLSAPTNYLRAE